MQISQPVVFPPAFYARYSVDGLAPGQVDEMLAHGWFRNDLHVYTEAARYMGDGWHPSVMLRLPLAHFTWKKRLGKLLRRNQALFRVEIGPYKTTPQKEELWRVFKSTVHGWVFVPELTHHLFRQVLPARFNTWELCVFYGEKLVAFSIFDRGLQSLASLEAAYDPAYDRYSLGIFTMLMEIEYARLQGMAYYYPGFLPKGIPMFDYKLRPGGMEFYRLTEKRWVAYESLLARDWLMEGVLDRLEKLGTLLRQAGLVSKVAYGMFSHYPGQEVSPKAYNILLVIGHPRPGGGPSVFLAAWDVVRERFRLFEALLPMPVLEQDKFPGGHTLQLFQITGYSWLGEWAEAEKVVGEMARMGGSPL